MDSRRKKIIGRFAELAKQITVENGYRTNAGLYVKVNKRLVFGEGDPKYGIAIIVGLESVKPAPEHVVVRLPINLQAIVAETDVEEPWDVVEDVIADIKQAVEQQDRTLGRLVKSEIERGATQTLEQEPGSEFTGTEITYIATYPEMWGHPEL